MDIDRRFEPVTVRRWEDFEMLFCSHGAFYHCWRVASRHQHGGSLMRPER
ncbi:hypothetical protein [Neorhizobium sp. LjRoot104]